VKRNTSNSFLARGPS